MAEFADAKSGSYCMCTREKCSDECGTYRQFRPKPITNANRIRAMSDNELATIFSENVDCAVCMSLPGIESKECPRNPHQTCSEFWLDWLRQEAEP